MTDAATTREASPPQPEDDRTDSAAMSCVISGQDADRAADNAWLDAPAATRRDLIWRAYRHIDSVFAFGLGNVTDKLDRDHIIKAREDLHTALYGGRT